MNKKSLAIGLTIAATLLASASAFATDPMYFFNHSDLGAAGSTIDSWNGATAMKSWQGGGTNPDEGPTVEMIGGQKWVKNTYRPNVGAPWANEPGSSWGAWTGFRVAHPGASIPVNGATFMVAVKRGSQQESTAWNSIVDVMYGKLVLGISNNTGQIIVRRNNATDWASDTKALAVGQSAILSLICQADGSYEVFADGVSILTGGANGTMTEWDPFRTEYKDEPNWAGSSVPGGNWDAWRAAMAAQFPTAIDNTSWDTYWASWWGVLTPEQRAPYWGWNGAVPEFCQYINIGRNNPDGWTAFNGNIGDVKIWGSALSSGERIANETGMASAMGMGAAVPEPGSIVAMLSGLVGLAGYGIRRRK